MSKFFREKAQQCRELMKVANSAEVIAQLEIWAREFEEASVQAGPTVLIVAKTPPKVM